MARQHDPDGRFGRYGSWMGCRNTSGTVSRRTETFQRLSKGIAGFLGGYVAAKLDRVFDLLVDKTGGGPLIFNLRVVRSLSVGIACLLVASVTVFVARTYFQTSEG
jgi:hypothetical protein